MRIIAVDPGYGRIGIAILERHGGREALLYSECFETSKDLAQPERLNLVQRRLQNLIKKFKPEALAIEKLFFSKNKKTALMVAEARGVITSTAAENGLGVFEYTPAQIKVAVTGHGASDKRQVARMVKRVLNLKKEISHDDEYDAIAVGIAHLATHRAIAP